jgi:crotonobetainyl-CoA:carnitine CoA-transferase CaiB-like acyl-CoA transferase
MEVLDWKRLTAHEGYQVLEMEQKITTKEGKNMITTRCPIRIDGRRLFSVRPAPSLGQDNATIGMEVLK